MQIGSGWSRKDLFGQMIIRHIESHGGGGGWPTGHVGEEMPVVTASTAVEAGTRGSRLAAASDLGQHLRDCDVSITISHCFWTCGYDGLNSIPVVT